jgi:hypothetical protein
MTVTKYTVQILIIVCALLVAHDISAEMSGVCSDCHTMHNSQNGAEMTTFKDYNDVSPPTAAQDYLLRGTCLGCHAQGLNQKIVDVGSDIPQVYHNDGTGDLAGGNFAYIDGAKGGGADNTKGHNLIDFGNAENKQPPGRRHDISDMPGNLTCAGENGCHGYREGGTGTGLIAIKGSHHNNTGNKMDTADSIANSYRFLYWTKGLENNGQVSSSTKWQNDSPTNHNEYFGDNDPTTFTSCTTCHEALTQYARPASSTISGFCATCHGYFHFLDNSGAPCPLDPECDGIGDDTTSPFRRHPTDVILPGIGEYNDYNENVVLGQYSITAPVARQGPAVPDNISSTVTPGTDIVMCLSCHAAHATDNYKMLRWDYKSTSLSTALSGCNVCHTSKD